MNKVANLPISQRRDLFREAAARRSLNAAVVEKDFWVCWVLKQVFEDPALGSRLVFKGGTYLSKVFGLIDRFSEDVDLVLDWRLLGVGAGGPGRIPDLSSATQCDRFSKRLNEQAAAYIAGELLSQLQPALSRCGGVSCHVDHEDAHTVMIAYPAAFSVLYIRPEIRLEIGPLASWSPSERRSIQPYAAQEFPRVFEDANCPVVAITATRTFWEKATILHQQAHRRGAMLPRYSRHYYDMHKLAGSAVRDAALADLDLLAQVVEFKRRFYPSKWARYEDAKPGTFRLVPPEKHLKELRDDYREMRVMIFSEAPKFDDIISTLRRLEQDINGLVGK